ncbi:hypothetical protein [Solidesulfovibrio sp.]|uniref:hypothetical protein n=1 Tax=Solidesulfovibrio sp. TaxID=2910990 RepID=UPI0026226726|nr:hypothetical protein [Solidesulfovibrio sp.]
MPAFSRRLAATLVCLLAPAAALAAACPGLPPGAGAKEMIGAAIGLLDPATTDPAKARAAAACLAAAHAAGDAGAAAARGQLALSGRSERSGRPDPTLALSWFAKAAAAGSPQGDLAMGLALLRGQGAPADPYWACWRLGRALRQPGLTPEEKALAARAADEAAAKLAPAERAAIEANLSGGAGQ